MGKWIFLITISTILLIVGLATHLLAIVLLAGITLFGGVLVFDAFEEGTDNEFLNAVFKFLER